MSTTITGVRIVDMPDLGAITDDSSVVGEHAGSGRFAATAFRTYVAGLGTSNTGRNLLHNPLFNIAQRAGPWTGVAYTADRWQQVPNGSTTMSASLFSFGSAGGAATGDEAAVRGHSTVVVGSAAAGSYALLAQKIEGIRRLSGKQVTLSFWACCGSGTAKLGIDLAYSFGTGGSPSVGAGFPSTQFVSLSTTWARLSFTFAMPSSASYTFGTNGDDSIQVGLVMSDGANALGTGIGNQSGTFNLWGVQLEVGSVATALEKPDPRYDLSNCQRFFQSGGFSIGGYAAAGIGVYTPVTFTTQMRTAALNVTITPVTLTNCGSSGVVGLNVNGISPYVVVTATGAYVYAGTFTASADL